MFLNRSGDRRGQRSPGPALRRLALACALVLGVAPFGADRPARAAATSDTGVFVEIKASEAPDAKVVERWRLYGNSHALVIGIDDYTNGWPRLSNAINDAERVAAALEDRGFGVTLLKDLTSAEIRTALRRFFSLKGADPDTRLFVWFSGHGYTEFGEGYLVPADAPLPDKPEFLISALHMRDFGGLVRLAKAKHAMAIFDSCFSGTIFAVQRSRPPAAITRATVKPVRQFLTSGDADQQVSDDGTFSRLFIDALEGSARADANNDGYLTGSELSLHLEQRLTNLTEGLQTPRSGKLRDPRYDGGDFVFLLPQQETETRVAAAPLPAQPGTTEMRSAETALALAPRQGPNDATFDLEFWNAIKGSDNRADFLAYLEAFPNGRFAPLARVRVNSLSSAQPDAPANPPQQAALPAPAAADPPAAEPPAPSPAEQELVAWERIKGSGDPNDFAAFLQRFPDGNFADLARFRRDQLTPEPPAPQPKAPEQTPPQQTALLATPPKPAAPPPLERIDQPYRAARNANVRRAPDRNAAKIDFLKSGAEVVVLGKVAGQRWLAVELEGGEVGYVYAPLLAPVPESAPQTATATAPAAQQALVPAPKSIPLERIGQRYAVLKNASVRSGPDSGTTRLETLRAGTSIQVAGKVTGADWLAVERDGRHLGYVYAPLLAPERASPAPQQAASPPPQTAALTPPANPLDGSWGGQGVGNSDLCNGSFQISMVTSNGSVSGTLSGGGQTASISGRLDRRGQFVDVYATVKQVRVEFTGRVSGGRVVGRWHGEKRKNFGEVTCAGSLDLGRQAGTAVASARPRTSAPQQAAVPRTSPLDGVWSGTGKGTTSRCQGDFQIELRTSGSVVTGTMSRGSQSATISGEVDGRGRLGRTFATYRGFLVEFKGGISGNRLKGAWKGEKRKEFGEIFCNGTMELSRRTQSGAAFER